MVTQIQPTTDSPSTFPVLFAIGFRPFFLGAGLTAFISMVVWMLVLVFNIQPDWLIFDRVPAMQWHAHEMIYGFALAVIAGFLLTAVRNWTQLPTAQDMNLLVLFACWAAARLALLFGPILAAAILDFAFGLQLVFYIVKPIVKVRQWRQLLVMAVLIGLMSGNLLFYLGILGVIDSGVRLGLYLGFYLIIGMILIIGGRVIPTFISSGIESSVNFAKLPFINLSIAITYILFIANELILEIAGLQTIFSIVLFLCCLIRVASWYHHDIWQKPLLWSLYLSYASLGIGFLLKVLAQLGFLSPYIALHMMAVGCVAFITLGMMSRVSIGHTGRSIHSPPAMLAVVFVFICLATLFRVLGPLLWPAEYIVMVALSQLCWIIAFGLFLILFTPILTRPRIDGKRT